MKYINILIWVITIVITIDYSLTKKYCAVYNPKLNLSSNRDQC